MDAFELLKTDHEKVAELFDQLETATGKRKLDVFKRIKAELDLHTHVEETIFYPALEKPEATHDLTLEAYEEHNVVKALLTELSKATTADDEWQAKAKVLRENVEHHVDEEENELFDKANGVLTDERLEELGNRMAAEKARKQGKPEPNKTDTKKPKNNGAAKPGLISAIANFVGLGSKTKKAAKKGVTKKKSAATKSAKKSSKSSKSVATKRTSSKKTVARKTGSKSNSPKKQTTGKSSKKRANAK